MMSSFLDLRSRLPRLPMGIWNVATEHNLDLERKELLI
jgi:hypothetical protein